jgi:gamma-glutamyltranspeptidase/glutathione hydrolase
VDAAVAVAFALAVTWPPAGNIGGGGFMLVYCNDSRQVVTVEYREKAPARATAELCSQLLNYRSRGHASVGVPGTVRGLALAHKRFGSLPWAELVDPAVGLAANGFRLPETLADSFNRALALARKLDQTGPAPRPASAYAEFIRVFSKPDRSPWSAGDLFVQPDLARTLAAIRDGGPDSFYRGPIAERIVAEMKRGAGLIEAEDLAGYEAKLRLPVHGVYRGYEVYGPPPPSSGGTTLIQMLNMLETARLAQAGWASTETIHFMVECMRRAYRDRALYLGDPDHVAIPPFLVSKHYARQLAGSIVPDRATASTALVSGLLEIERERETTHFSIVDRFGNAVSNTYTLQDSWGSLVVVRGAGFILNNEMTDFNLQPGRTTSSGLIGTAANLVAPGKRMLSSQTPTIVTRRGSPFLVTGSPGGRTIINTVLNVVTNMIDFRMDLRAAVDAPRLHHQWLPDVIRFEKGRIPEAVQRRLKQMGHRLRPIKVQGDAHSIWIDPATGLRVGAADKRRCGKAAGY